MTRVFIAGYYGAGNAGDEAILRAILEDLRTDVPGLVATVVSADPGHTQTVHGVRAVQWNDIPAIVNAAEESDAILLGGGGVFHDYWGVDPDTILSPDAGGIAFYTMFPILSVLLSKPLIIHAVGVGPLFTEAGQQYSRMAFEIATAATVRDPESQQLLLSLALPSGRVRVSADPAFRLKTIENEQIALNRLLAEGVAVRRPLFGIALRDWGEPSFREFWTKEVAEAIDRFLAAHGGTAIFLPFQRRSQHATNDHEVASMVRDALGERHAAFVLEREYAPEEMASILGTCDLVLGMRYHAIVFAALRGAPVAALAYDPKVRHVMRQLECEEAVLDLDHLSADRLEGLLHAVAARGSELGERLKNRASVLADEARENSRLVAQGLTSGARQAYKIPELAQRVLGRIALLRSVQAVDQTRTMQAMQEELHNSQLRHEELTRQEAEQRNALSDSYRRLSDLEQELQASQSDAAGWRALYEAIAFSRSYRLMAPVRRAYSWLRNAAHRSGQLGRAAARRVRKLAGNLARRVLPARIKRSVRVLLQRPAFVLQSRPGQTVKVYTRRADLFAAFPERMLLTDGRPVQRRPVSLVATVKNEGRHISEWLESVRTQVRPPDELVITDGGSSDDTVAKITDIATRYGLNVRLISAPGVNVATGRNLAIQNASHELIAVTDGGCRLEPHWLDLLTLPFDIDPRTDLVGGYYEAAGASGFERAVGNFLVPRLEDVDPATFSPSSRSLAFTKTLWQAAGGYPEHLTLSGEDTVFNFHAKRHASIWAFVPDAIVRWHVPGSFRRLFRTLYSWGRGDGEVRLYAGTYIKLGIAYAAMALVFLLGVSLLALQRPSGWLGMSAALVLWLVLLNDYGVLRTRATEWRSLFWNTAVLTTIHLGQVRGYLRGWWNRSRIYRIKVHGVTKNVLLLAGIPIHDTGGGQRSTQLALEFLRRGFKVTYVNRFPSYETQPMLASWSHPELDCLSYEEFDLGRYVDEHATLLPQTHVLVEFPLPEYLVLARELQQRGALIVYDLMDEWSSGLGGTWYSSGIEDRLIATSDLLVATSLELKEVLERRAPGRSVLLLPNAVNLELFDSSRTYPRPSDLPTHRPIIGYVGSMYGQWFREDLVLEVARRYPEASVVVVGDHRQRFRDPPENLYTLGLKPHTQIPAYVANFDVCLIPFDPVPLIQATSPLKVFEYLALGKPVVATSMRELQALPNVYIAANDAEFVGKINHALRDAISSNNGELAAFVRKHCWKARIDSLLEAADWIRTRGRDAPRQVGWGFDRALAGRVRSIRIDKIDFSNFKSRYFDPRPGIDEEKLLEYYVGYTWLELRPDDIFIDIAAQDCPFAFFVRDTVGCRVYRQDLYHMDPGIHGTDIGSNAANLPLPTGSVSKMSLFNSFEHFEGDDDSAFIREAGRVLTPGGRLCIVPLFIGPEYVVEPQGGWTDGAGVKHCWGEGARFSRIYDVRRFEDRILRFCDRFQVQLLVVENAGEIGAGVYLQYFLILERV